MQIRVSFPVNHEAMAHAIAMHLHPDEGIPTKKHCWQALKTMYEMYGLNWDKHVTETDREDLDWAKGVLDRYWE